MTNFLDTLGGRKFVFALLVVVLAFVLTFARVVTPEIFLDFVKFIGAGYFTANVVAGMTDKKSE